MPPAAPPILRQQRGACLTGGDTLWSGWGSGGPISGTNYQFVSAQDVDYCLSKGMNTFRVLLSWEAVQPRAYGPVPAQGNYGAYFARLKALVDYITARGAVVILDVHGGDDSTFARYYGRLVGSEVQVEAFVDLWQKLVRIFAVNPRVQYGITNEPTRMPTMQWFGVAQAVVSGIRVAGGRGKIWMPGNYFSGPGAWTQTSMYDTGSPKRSNAYGWDNARGPGLGLVDPIFGPAGLGVQVHLYFDPDGGGWSTDVADAMVGVRRLKVVVDWARPRGLKVLLGEVALKATSVGAGQAWRNLMAYVQANEDVVQGFTWWAYGPPAWWGGYQFTLSPPGGDYRLESPQMSLIKRDFRG